MPATEGPFPRRERCEHGVAHGMSYPTPVRAIRAIRAIRASAWKTGSRREVGIRVALGAGPADVIRTAATHTLFAFTAGVAVGLVASSLLARLASSLLSGVEPLDAASLLSACGLLIATGAIAALVPALRAARSDPLHALRGS